jgi:hypothetical protein
MILDYEETRAISSAQANRYKGSTLLTTKAPHHETGTMSGDADPWLSGWVRSLDCALRGDNRRGEGSLTGAPNTIAVAHDHLDAHIHLAS